MYTFGPVNSRRFGLSLGIDLSPFEKSCNFDCLYCELGSGKRVDFIKNPPRVEEIVKEVEKKQKLFPDLDVLTITANGEPTLYPYLDELVDKLNKIKKDTKLLILSNGSTVCDQKIVNTLKKIDIVKLSLDCASSRCFKRLDRPLKDIDLKKNIECFKNLDFDNLIIEILVVKGINDKKEEFLKLYEILKDIKLKRIDLGTIHRPPAFKVEGVDDKKLFELAKILKDLPVVVITSKKNENKIDFSKEDILFLLAHRPQSEFDVEYLFSKDSKKNLDSLIKEKKVEKRKILDVDFFVLRRNNE